MVYRTPRRYLGSPSASRGYLSSRPSTVLPLVPDTLKNSPTSSEDGWTSTFPPFPRDLLSPTSNLVSRSFSVNRPWSRRTSPRVVFDSVYKVRPFGSRSVPVLSTQSGVLPSTTVSSVLVPTSAPTDGTTYPTPVTHPLPGHRS